GRRNPRRDGPAWPWHPWAVVSGLPRKLSWRRRTCPACPGPRPDPSPFETELPRRRAADWRDPSSRRPTAALLPGSHARRWDHWGQVSGRQYTLAEPRRSVWRQGGPGLVSRADSDHPWLWCPGLVLVWRRSTRAAFG